MSRSMAVAAFTAYLVTAGSASAAELNSLTAVQVTRTAEGAQVVLSGTKAPTFTVFRMSDPDRLVIDLSSADGSAIRGHHEGAGPITGVVASQFSDDRASVARLLVALEKASQYDVRSDGTRVVVSVVGAGASAPAQPVTHAAVAAPAAPAAAPAVPAQAAVAPPAAPAAPAVASAAPVAQSAPEPPSDVDLPRGETRDNVVTAHLDEREVSSPATRVTGLRWRRDVLSVTTDGALAKYELIELTNPPRLALDLFGVSLDARAPRVRSNLVSDVRVGAHPRKVRVVLDGRGTMPQYRTRWTKSGVELVLSPAREDAPAAVAAAEIEIDGKKLELPAEATVAAAKPAETEPLRVAPAPPEPPPAAPAAAKDTLANVEDVVFSESRTGGTLAIKLSRAARYSLEKPDGASAVLTLEGVRLPKKLERSLDTSALGTPVQMISAFSVPGDGHRARLVVAASGNLDARVTKTAKGLVLHLKGQPVTEAVAVAPKTAGFTTEATRYAEQGAPKQTRYRGKRVSFEFKDIDIHNLLRIIAEISRRNIVVADDVSGRVTIRLRNVPWDQALELILRSKSLGKEELGNIIRVAPLKTLEEEAKLRAERRKALEVQENLVVQLIPVNYATAKDMSDKVKDVLTARGTVTVDDRTNVLIVKDIASNINRARSLVQNLDTQTPQVLIESRIVEANTNYTRELGIQWGTRVGTTPGNPTGLVFPSTFQIAGGSQQAVTTGVSATPNWAVNLPAAVGVGNGGALGFSFGSVGGAVELNLRLSALENQGQVKTISAPKVTTLDNNTARISQGISIPFTSASQQGTNVQFVEARLALEVTPHITQDGSVLMAIRAENNQPDPSLAPGGQPSIQRKEANTQVLVKDGDTTVIGGIYVRRGATSTSTVPLLGRIPILGLLFRNDAEIEERQELLIFITPRILNRQTIAQTL